MDINTVIDPILQIRKLKVTDLIFLNPKVLHFIVGHVGSFYPRVFSRMIPLLLLVLSSERNLKLSSIVFHTLILERFGKLCSDQLTK